MSHPLAAPGRRPLPSIALVAALALLALLLAPLRADAANPVILNSGSWLEGNAAGGERGGSSEEPQNANDLTFTLAVRHDRGEKVTGVKIDDDWNGSDNTASENERAVTVQQQSLAGGSDVSRVTYKFAANTGNMGFDCNPWDGTTNDVTKTLRVRPVVTGGGTMPLATATIWFTKPTGCAGSEDYAYVYEQAQNKTSIATGETVRFTFRADDADSTGSATVGGFRWRARRLTGPDAVTTAEKSVCGPKGDTTQRTLDVTFPDRGRWVVEAQVLMEDSCTNARSGKFFRLGAVDVNTAADASPTLALTPATKRLDHLASETTVAATTADGADSGQGGNVASIEWDTDSASGYETTLLGEPVDTGAGAGGNAITAADKQRTVSVAGKEPGTYTVRARVADSGAITSGDTIRRTKTASATYTVDAPPVASTPALAATDSNTPVDVALSGTDADADPLTWSAGAVSPAGAGTVTVAGNTATFTPAPDFEGTATFPVTADDGYNGAQAPSATKTATVQVEPSGPDTTITTAPEPIDPSATPEIAFASEDARSFECQLDAGGWQPCTSPEQLGPLTNGSHTFEVRGTDAAGHLEFFPAKHTWTVLDTTAPTATFTAEPASPSADTTPEFAFAADEEGATFACQLDDAPAVACDDGTFTADTLGDGEHTFTVVATDVGGNASLPVSRTFTVDTTGPAAQITGGPDGPTNDPTPEFSFTSEDGATFTCRIGALEVSPCPSPFTAPEELADGEHTFGVTAADALANVGTETVRTFTVDTKAPAAAAVSVARRTADPTPEVTLTHAEGGDGVTFRARVDEGEWESVAATFSTVELDDGEHTVEARSVDAAGNEGDIASAEVEVDTQAPVTTFADDAPTGPIADATPEFAFTADDDDATFACEVDGGGFDTCTSPLSITEALDDGEHTIAVRAIDALGNTEAPAATRTVTVDTIAPSAPDVTWPKSPTTDTTPELSFAHAADAGDGATFQVQVAGEWTDATSPLTLGTLAEGDNQVAVRSVDAAGNLGAATATTLTIDTTGPVVQITDGPGGPTADATPEFAFSSEDGARFACRIDDAEWGKCTAPYTAAELEDGEHTFAVRAADRLRNEGAAVTRTFTVDTTGPVVAITGGPTGPTSDATPELAFESEDDAEFACRIDAGEWGTCTSPFTAAPLADGEHTFSVQATDALGNVGAVVTRTITVDTIAPAAPQITDGPDGPTADATPQFTFTAEDSARFACRIDAGEWGKCASPVTTQELTDGDHTFSVKVSDSARNESAVTTRAFSVDTTAPQTTITDGPDGLTDDATPTLEFEANDAAATFAVSVDDGAWVAATSPLTLATLTDGAHTVAVRATDALDNVEGEPATVTFTVDTTAPGAPTLEGPAGETVDTTPTYTFAHAAGAGDGATFACKVDAADYAPCTSPTTLTELEDGLHTFSVRSVDAAGNAGAAATKTVEVDTTAPGTVIDGGPTGTIAEATARFTFASVDPDVARFECRVDGGAFAACTSPYTTGTLTNGDHLFEVRGTDALGNVESPAVQRRFTVAVPTPTVPPTVPPTPTPNPPVAGEQQQAQSQTERSQSLAKVLLAKVALSQKTLTAKKPKAALRFTLSEQARIVVRIEQSLARGGKTKYRMLRRIVRTGVAAGDRSLTITRTAAKKALPAGTYRVSIVATAINKRTQTVRTTLTVR